MRKTIKIAILSQIFLIGLTLSQLRPDFVNIKQYLGVSEECLRKISSEEYSCHKRFLNSFDTIGGEIGPKQESEDYKQLVCCNVWRYSNCIESALYNKPQFCTDKPDIQSLHAFPNNNNVITVYCADYPYSTYRCWRFPLWAVILCAVAAFFLIIGAVIGVWFWKRNQITYWRFRRKY